MRSNRDSEPSLWRVKVRGLPTPTYLWGGERFLVNNLREHGSSLYLLVRVPETADSIDLGLRKKDGSTVEYGRLQPGEMFTIRLDDISGVYGSCSDKTDTHVECGILVAR